MGTVFRSTVGCLNVYCLALRDEVEGIGQLDADLGLWVAEQIAPLVADAHDDFVTVRGDGAALLRFVGDGGHLLLVTVAQPEASPAVEADGLKIAGCGRGLIVGSGRRRARIAFAGPTGDEEDGDAGVAGF